MKLVHSRLTKRYVITVLVVILFVLTSLYFVAVNVMNKSVRQQMEYRDGLIAKTLGAQIEVILHHAIADMRQVSPVVNELGSRVKSSYETEIETIISQNALYLFIEVYKGHEQMLRIPDISFSHPVRAERILHRLSWSQTSYISNMITLPDGRKTVAIAYPAFDEQERYAGTIIAYLNLSILSNQLDKFVIGHEGMNAVLDRNGTIIAHTDKQYIGTSIEQHEVGFHLKKERFGLWDGVIFDENMVVSYRPLLLGSMGLIVGETLHQALAPARSVTLLLFQGFIIVAVIALGLAIFSSWRVIRPVMLLIQQVKEYKEGRRKVFDSIQTNDEMEDLSFVLSDMATDLREKERNLFYILESIPYGVITTDQDGRIMTFNKGAETLMGYTREEVVGKLIFQLPIKHDIQEFIVLRTLKEGKAFEEAESYIVDKEKNIHDVRIYASLFKGEQNEHIGSLLVIRDVSEIKKLEEYVKQSERLASIGQLTAGIAHEIKNPLSIIQAAAETIRLQLDDEMEEKEIVEELTNDILVSSERMNKLLTDFLKFAKHDVNQAKTPTDLILLTEELLHLLRRKCSEYNVKVTSCYEAEEAFVLGDKHQLTQVLLNVLLNSLQAMKSGGAVHIELTGEAACWNLIVFDTGEGIAQSKLKWIFNPFYSTKSDGTGLGLSIAHEIITQHGGKIWADSKTGEGTAIHIQLPKGEKHEKESLVC
jgi:PAS domain S-box-containing protein